MQAAQKTNSDILESKLASRIHENIRELREVGYYPRILMDMIDEMGVVKAIKELIANEGPSYGFSRLYKLNKLGLSIEVLVLDKEFKELFSDEDRNKAQRRLKIFKYNLAEDKNQ